MDPLLANLLDLLRELDAKGIPLTVGGGFGLYLKRGHLERAGEQTLFAEFPGVRATNDIDLFLRAQVLADLAPTKEAVPPSQGSATRRSRRRSTSNGNAQSGWAASSRK